MTIRTNPPGALVYVDKQAIGVSPVSTSFTYYGTRNIEVVHDGFETTVVRQHFSPRWYEVPPLDFFSENLWPFELRDERAIDIAMPPQRSVPSQEIVQRAEQLRQNAAQGIAVTPAQQ